MQIAVHMHAPRLAVSRLIRGSLLLLCPSPDQVAADWKTPANHTTHTHLLAVWHSGSVIHLS